MARFRNRLIHIYWDIDDERIHGFIQEDLEDVPAFVEIILERLQLATKDARSDILSICQFAKILHRLQPHQKRPEHVPERLHPVQL